LRTERRELRSNGWKTLVTERRGDWKEGGDVDDISKKVLPVCKRVCS